MKIFLSLLVLCIWDAVCGEPEPLSIGEFFQNIPDQIGSAWRNLLDVIREPVKARRLGSIGRRKAFKPGFMQPTTNTSTTSVKALETTTLLSTSKFEKPIRRRPHANEAKLPIPFIKSSYKTGNELIPNSAEKRKLEKELDGQKPYYMRSTLIQYPTEETTLSLRSKVRIPVLLEPTYESVNDWNNNQRPQFAEIHKIPKGTTAFAHILKYMYGGTIPIYYKPVTQRETTFNPERKARTKEVVILI